MLSSAARRTCRTTKFIYTQSTTVSVPSSELGPPPPLSQADVSLPRIQREGVQCTGEFVPGTHSPAGEGVGLGESQFGRLDYKLSTLSTLCARTFEASEP
jgi:hypothetical protein